MKCFTLYLRKDNLTQREAEAASSMVRIHCKFFSKDELFFFEQTGKNMLILTLVFKDAEDAENVAEHFNSVPDWLKQLGFTEGLFYGRPFCLAWLEPENLNKNKM